MKTKSALDLYKSIRKPLPPQGSFERPQKGGGYRRHPKHKGQGYATEE